MLTQKKPFIFQKNIFIFRFCGILYTIVENSRDMMKRLYAAYGSNLNETLIK